MSNPTIGDNDVIRGVDIIAGFNRIEEALEYLDAKQGGAEITSDLTPQELDLLAGGDGIVSSPTSEVFSFTPPADSSTPTSGGTGGSTSTSTLTTADLDALIG